MKEDIQHPKILIERMLEDQKWIHAYLESGDESQKPKDITFVKPAVLTAKALPASKR